MLLRILTGMCLLACSASVRADLVNTNFNTDLTGWASNTNPVGLGDWLWTSGSLLSQPSAEITQLGSGGTFTLSQQFTPTGLDPSLVIGADLSWTQYLFASSPSSWSASQQFRVLLTDQSATTLVAFTTTAASPQEIGTVGSGTTASANQAALVAFLAQLAGGEQITLAFEAFTTGTVFAAVDNINFSFTLSATPEPTSLAFTGLAVGALVLARRRRAKKQSSNA